MRGRSLLHDEVFYSFYKGMGYFGSVVATEAGLCEVNLPAAIDPVTLEESIRWRFPGARRDNSLSKAAAELLARYFRREPVEFELPLYEQPFTPFQREVYRAVRDIAYGSVRSYGEIAREILRPGAARGVGAAMARNPLPIIIPCHRVIGSSGKLTGYSAPGGLELKAELLRMEREVLEAQEGGRG